MKKKLLTEIEVAEYLVAFRERPQAEQEASPIYQELIAFSGWGMAKYAPKAPLVSPEIPDPRMSSADRAKLMKELNPITDTGKGKTEPGAMTTVGSPAGAQNPWVDTRTPEGKGPLFLGVNTEVPPPFAGTWERKEGGWFRKE
jgi:hypothetical protein